MPDEGMSSHLHGLANYIQQACIPHEEKSAERIKNYEMVSDETKISRKRLISIACISRTSDAHVLIETYIIKDDKKWSEVAKQAGSKKTSEDNTV